MLAHSAVFNVLCAFVVCVCCVLRMCSFVMVVTRGSSIVCVCVRCV
jgi:hypothetical protein